MPDEGSVKEAHKTDATALKDKQIADLTDDLKRLQAEFENFKKRTEKEWSERSKIATQRLMTDLLAVLDSFDKALEETKEDCDKDSLEAGLDRLHKQLLQTLQREGLKEIKAEGMFDPFMHEALMTEERDDVEEGQILEVYQKGYSLGQKPLRPARVKVAKKKELEGNEAEVIDNDDEQSNRKSNKEEDENQ